MLTMRFLSDNDAGGGGGGDDGYGWYGDDKRRYIMNLSILSTRVSWKLVTR